MTRKTSATWAPTSVPTLRDQWLKGSVDETVAVYREKIAQLTEARRHSDVEFLERRIANLLDQREQLAHADLYWASRDMSDFTLSAAATLPEWTPRAMMPSPSGIICWAKPMGLTQFVVANSPGVKEMYTDVTAWITRRDGRLDIITGMRTDRAPQAVREPGLHTPFLDAIAASVDLDEPVAGADDDGVAAPAAVLATAWLLMAQDGVTDHKRLKLSRKQRVRPPTEAHEPADSSHEYVSLIELHNADSLRIARPAKSDPKDRHYTHRWWVRSHWRQQACGPGNKFRRPLLILPYIKGPDGTPLATDRVHVWRH